jgi:hypothetical protein
MNGNISVYSSVILHKSWKFIDHGYEYGFTHSTDCFFNSGRSTCTNSARAMSSYDSKRKQFRLISSLQDNSYLTREFTETTCTQSPRRLHHQLGLIQP